jgi:hypothetical protein
VPWFGDNHLNEPRCCWHMKSEKSTDAGTVRHTGRDADPPVKKNPTARTWSVRTRTLQKR